MSTFLFLSALLPITYLTIAAGSLNRFYLGPGRVQVYSVLRFRWYLLITTILLWLAGIITTILNPPQSFGIVNLTTIALLLLIPASVVISGCKMFTAVQEANFLSPEEIKSRLSPDDPIIGLEINGTSHAYPIKWMKQPQIVEDIIDGKPIIVTYSVHNKKAVAFSSNVKLHSLRLIFPNHREENVMLYDESNKRLFQHLTGEIIFGPNKGSKIPTIPLRIVPWVTWESLHPDSKVFYHEPKTSKSIPTSNLFNRLRSMRLNKKNTAFNTLA